MKHVYETISKAAVVATTVLCLTLAASYILDKHFGNEPDARQQAATAIYDIERKGDCLVIKGTYEVCK